MSTPNYNSPLNASHLALINEKLRALNDLQVNVIDKCLKCGVPVEGYQANAQMMQQSFEALKNEFFPQVNVNG